MGLRSSKPRETSNFDSYLKALQLDKKKYLSMRSREAREGNGRCLSLRETASICIPSENKHVEYVQIPTIELFELNFDIFRI